MSTFCPLFLPCVMVSVMLDKRRLRTKGENAGRYHVKLVVNFKTGRKRYPTNCFCTEEEFGNLARPRAVRLKRIQSRLFELQGKARDLVDENPYISPELFFNKFTGSGQNKSILDSLENYADSLEAGGQVGNATVYRSAASSFRKLSKDLFFWQVNVDWLKRYERWMLKQGRSHSTVGINLRCLRTVFNMAISDNIVSADLYPFGIGKRKYKIPTGQAFHRALSEKDKNKLLAMKGKEVDFWKFSYFCYGMNFGDIARLKVGDVGDKFIMFDRGKSINTKRRYRKITPPVRKEVKEIIARWGTRSLNPNDYLFPILSEGLTVRQQKDRIHNFIKDTNEGLKALGFGNLTTQSARHTFATISKKHGAPIRFIQEALGHTDIRTTEHYLDSFDLESQIKFSKRL